MSSAQGPLLMRLMVFFAELFRHQKVAVEESERERVRDNRLVRRLERRIKREEERKKKIRLMETTSRAYQRGRSPEHVIKAKAEEIGRQIAAAAVAKVAAEQADLVIREGKFAPKGGFPDPSHLPVCTHPRWGR